MAVRAGRKGVLTMFSGTGRSHYNPDEARDWRGRWTSSGDAWEKEPLRDPSPIGRANTLLGHSMGRLHCAGLNRSYTLPTPAEAESFSRTLRAWNAATGLDDQAFHDLFTKPFVSALATTRRLRDAARGSVLAQNFGQMVEASNSLGFAIKEIGVDRWPHVLPALEERAAESRWAVPEHSTPRLSDAVQLSAFVVKPEPGGMPKMQDLDEELAPSRHGPVEPKVRPLRPPILDMPPISPAHPPLTKPNTSPKLTLENIANKTADEIRKLAKDKGFVPDKRKPDKWRDPVTGKERLRIDNGHIDKDTNKPYDLPNAAAPHVHGYDESGAAIGDPLDPHFPLR